MTSQINPNNIDGAYPVAGQDNNSQGFRDNFTNIKVNFQYAANEINDLDTKAVLKSALTGTTLDNNMNDQLIYAAQIRDFSATRVQVTNTSGPITIDYSAGHYQTISTTGNISLSFTNFPPSQVGYGVVRLAITVNSTAYTVTLPSSVTEGTFNLQGFNQTTRAISFSQTGVFTYDFTSTNGGTAITVSCPSRNQDPIFLPSGQDLNDGDAVSLATTVSYFTTTGPGDESCNLAAGANGQIKTLIAVNVDAADMVIVVTNPGWGGAGNIRFNGPGQACTLQYIASKWFCIGNNGAAFT